MECSRIKELLSDYMDGTLDAEARVRVEEHLKGCEGCRNELDSLRELVNELGSLPHVQAPEDFLARVHERIEQPSMFSKILHALFFPLRLKIPLQVATVAVVAVLVFAVFTVMWPERQMEDIPPVSEPVIVHKGYAPDVTEKKLERDSYGLRSAMKKAMAPQKAKRKETVEMVLLISDAESGIAQAPRKAVPVPPSEKRVGAVRLKRSSMTHVQKSETLDQDVSQDRPKAEWLHEEAKPQGPPVAEDEDTRRVSMLTHALSRVRDLMRTAGGTVLSVDYESQTGRPRYVVLEIPVRSYNLVLQELNRIGMLRAPLPALPEQAKDTIEIGVRFMPAS